MLSITYLYYFEKVPTKRLCRHKYSTAGSLRRHKRCKQLKEYFWWIRLHHLLRVHHIGEPVSMEFRDCAISHAIDCNRLQASQYASHCTRVAGLSCDSNSTSRHEGACWKSIQSVCVSPLESGVGERVEFNSSRHIVPPLPYLSYLAPDGYSTGTACGHRSPSLNQRVDAIDDGHLWDWASLKHETSINTNKTRALTGGGGALYQQTGASHACLGLVDPVCGSQSISASIICFKYSLHAWSPILGPLRSCLCVQSPEVFDVDREICLSIYPCSPPRLGLQPTYQAPVSVSFKHSELSQEPDLNT